MTRHAIVVRPEPGNAATIRRLTALGLTARAIPLFAVQAVDWTMPDPGGIGALLVTSANAIRHGGEKLAALTRFPVIAVGEASAQAARTAGFTVVLVGEGDAADAIRGAQDGGWTRLLHLAGRDRAEGPDVRAIALYASDPLEPPRALGRRLAEGVVLLHSPRAARRLAELVADRGDIRIAALSGAVAAAAGEGWERIAVPALPTDTLLTALARGLAE